MSAAVGTIGRTHPEVEVLGITYFDLAASFVDDVRESDLGGMVHGGEFETSLMPHRYPGLVSTDEMPATPFDDPYELADRDLPEPGPLSVYRPFDDLAEAGIARLKIAGHDHTVRRFDPKSDGPGFVTRGVEYGSG